MKHLIPHFIQQQYQKKRMRGQFRAASMFVDMSGFTQLTGTLMQHEKDGAEVLTEALNAIFHPIVAYVYDHGGMISSFAGDAFTALFPIRRRDAHLHAVQAAFFIHGFFDHHPVVNTKYGDFEMGVKIGLSMGSVNWGILGKGDKLSYLFRGEAVYACAQAEHFAEKGDVIADLKIMPMIQAYTRSEPTKTHFRLHSLQLDLPAKRSKKNRIDPAVLSRFVLDEVIHLQESAEFRYVCPVFISFREPENDEILDRFVSETLALVDQYHGYFNKIDFGDKGHVMLILFGAPVAFENNVERALDFLLALEQVSAGLGIQWRGGLTYGLVYAGLMGSDERCEYTAIGDIVNLSARFMMQAEWGAIYLDEHVRRYSQQKYEITHAGEFAYKGIAEPVSTYQLTGKKSIVETFFTGQMVGRDRELEALQTFLQPIFEHRFGGVVYVDGIAGMGKSRLVNELRKSVVFQERDPSVSHKTCTWFYLPCDEILRESFNPVVYFLNDYFGQSKQDSEEENKARFEREHDRLLSDLAGLQGSPGLDEIVSELQRTKSILGAVVNLHWEQSLYEQLDAKNRYDNTLYAVKNLIKAESLIQPVVIELEDGHWIDPDSVAFLDVLTRNVDAFHFAIISACRHRDDGSAFDFGLTNVSEHRIELAFLGREAAEALILDTLRRSEAFEGPVSLSGPTLDFIFDKSEGNPFYLEQITLYLQENQLLDSDFNLVSDAFAIPTGINAIIIARVDRLSLQVKEVIKAAAVVGREFEIQILSAVLQSDIHSHIQVAADGQIWSELSELRYIFKHALLKDVVYEMQLRVRLVELHRLTAEAIEQLYAADLSRYYGDLAWHYEKAEVEDKAIDYLGKAGDYARENYQNQQVIDLYDRLLTALAKAPEPSPDLMVDTLLKKGGILLLIGRWDDCQAASEEALRLSEKAADRRRIALAHQALGALLRGKGQFEQSLAHLALSLGICQESGDQQRIADTLNHMGMTYINKGDYPTAMAHLEQCLKIWQELGDKRGICNVVGNLGIVCHHRGDQEASIAHFEQCLEIYGELDDQWGIARVFGNLGLASEEKGDYESAMAYYEKSLSICRALGVKAGISIQVGNMGIVYKEGGDYKAAMDHYEEALKICDELGDRPGAARNLSNMGIIYTDTGDYESAMQCCEKSIEISEEMGDKRCLSKSTSNIGNIYRAKGDYESALMYYDQAIAVGREIGVRYLLCDYLVDKAEALYLTQEFAEARVLSEEGLKMAEETGRHVTIFPGKVLSAKLDFALGHREKALAMLSEMLAQSEKESEIADLNYELWKLEPGDRNAEKGEKALKMYQTLYERTPDVKFKKRMDELSTELKDK